MSFAIIHMQKIKTGGIKGIENHNERFKESKTNPDINPEKSFLNKSLYENHNNKTYYNRVKDRIKELNLPKAVRKDAVTMCGFVCTSDKEYFDKLPQSEQDKFFKESYNFLKDRYGEKNVVASTVHYDEKTPHLHCYIVPVTNDGRLSAKDVFTRTELRKLQTDYPKYMNEKGFDLERGLSSDGKRKHIDTQELKIQTKQQEIEKAKTELVKSYNKLKTDYEAVKDVTSTIWDLEHLEAKKSFIGAKITLSEDDYNKLLAMSKQAVLNSNKVRYLELENKNLKDENKSFKDGAYKKADKAEELKKDNQKLKDKLKDLTQQAKAMFDTLEKHDLVPEAQEQLKTMKEAERVAEKVMKFNQSKGWER